MGLWSKCALQLCRSTSQSWDSPGPCWALPAWAQQNERHPLLHSLFPSSTPPLPPLASTGVFSSLSIVFPAVLHNGPCVGEISALGWKLEGLEVERRQELTGPDSPRVSRDPGRILPGPCLAPASCAKSPHAEVVGRVLRMQDVQDHRSALGGAPRGGSLPVHGSPILRCGSTVVDVGGRLGASTQGICWYK